MNINEIIVNVLEYCERSINFFLVNKRFEYLSTIAFDPTINNNKAFKNALYTNNKHIINKLINDERIQTIDNYECLKRWSDVTRETLPRSSKEILPLSIDSTMTINNEQFKFGQDIIDHFKNIKDYKKIIGDIGDNYHRFESKGHSIEYLIDNGIHIYLHDFNNNIYSYIFSRLYPVLISVRNNKFHVKNDHRIEYYYCSNTEISLDKVLKYVQYCYNFFE